jgi:hypothetical protein
LTSKEFAAREGLKAKSLLWWSSKLRREARPGSLAVPKKAAPVSFVEVSAVAFGMPIRVRLAGADMEVPPGADEATLMAVVRALRSGS